MRYGQSEQAVAAIMALRAEYGAQPARERNDPYHLIKSKDVLGTHKTFRPLRSHSEGRGSAAGKI